MATETTPHNWAGRKGVTKGQRAHMGKLMDLLVEHEPAVHYAQVRPMRTRSIMSDLDLAAALAAPGGVRMDCSESVTLICKLAGLRDPNGAHYDGSGFTGTLLANLPHYSKPENAMTGALVVFGPGTGHHVCMVRRPGHDPELFSHGMERGPLLVPLSVERKYQSGPVTFLSIAGL